LKGEKNGVRLAAQMTVESKKLRAFSVVNSLIVKDLQDLQDNVSCIIGDVL